MPLSILLICGKRFPLIEDFEIVLEKTEIVSEGYQIFFYSEQRGGYTAGFVWWDYAEKDLCKEGFKIPLSAFLRSREQEYAISVLAANIKRFFKEEAMKFARYVAG